MYISTALEGHDVQLFRKGTSDAKAFTISFFVRSNVTGTGVLEFWDRDNDRHICKTYTIDSADTWERKVINFDMETSNAFTDDVNKSVNIDWWIESGSDFDSGTLATSWASRTNANRAVGQNLNIASSTDNEFLLTGCMIVPGTFDSETIPDYPIETTEQNLARCQRYFEKVTVDYVGSSGGSGTKVAYWSYKVPKRAVPTITEANTTKSGVQHTSVDAYGINRSGDNSADLGLDTTADAEI